MGRNQPYSWEVFTMSEAKEVLGIMREALTPAGLVDELTYISYAHNRKLSPEVSSERWAAIYPNAAAMERRYQEELGVVKP